MKFTDSVDLILKQKPGNVWSISPEQSVYEAFQEMEASWGVAGDKKSEHARWHNF